MKYEDMQPEWLEYPEDHREDMKALCTAFADPDARADRGLPDPPKSSEVVAELTAIIERVRDMETPLADARRKLKPSFLKDQVVEVYEAAATAYRILFAELCDALRRAGLTISSGEVSAVKRSLKGLPDRDVLAASLELLKGKSETKLPTLPAKGEKRRRATDEQARAMYRELRENGLISCAEDAFLAWLGETSTGSEKAHESPLSWHEDDPHLPAFVDFIRHYNRVVNGPQVDGQRTNSIAAICAAFGMTDEKTVQRIRRQVSRKPIN